MRKNYDKPVAAIFRPCAGILIGSAGIIIALAGIAIALPGYGVFTIGKAMMGYARRLWTVDPEKSEGAQN